MKVWNLFGIQVIYLDTSLPNHDGKQISEDNLAREKHSDQELRPLRNEDLWYIIRSITGKSWKTS